MSDARSHPFSPGRALSPCWGWAATACRRRARWRAMRGRGRGLGRQRAGRARASAPTTARAAPTCAAIDFAGVDALVLSPGIPHRLPAAASGGGARARRRRADPVGRGAAVQRGRAAGSRARFVGITGTNGKSTTTALMAHILLSGAGKPSRRAAISARRSAAARCCADDGIYVLEMSSYSSSGSPRSRFDVAALLNLSPDHLDRHGDMAGYVAAKRAIFDRQAQGDIAVVGVDDPATRARSLAAAHRRAARVIAVSGCDPADVWCEDGMLRDGRGRSCDGGRAALPGAHNAQNAAAAAAMAGALGASRGGHRARHRDASPACRTASSGSPPSDGVAFVNDSKATNADAAARALACYDRIYLDRRRRGQGRRHRAARAVLPAHRPRLLIGRDAPRFRRDAARATACRYEIAGTLDAAVPCGLRRAARARQAPRRAAVAGLRLLRPVHRFRGARRPLRRSSCARPAHAEAA